MALHSLITHPDVGLDVLHDVADMEIAIGVGQGGGNKQAALGHKNGFGAVKDKRLILSRPGRAVRRHGPRILRLAPRR
jgi:hypothetical protein